MTAKFSLAQQIEEIEREIGLRKNVYARKIASGEMRQSIADYHMGRIEAALGTLKWLKENETKIKSKIDAADQHNVVTQLPAPEMPASGRVYHERCTAFLDLAKGGWLHLFDILHEGKVIGAKSVGAETRKGPVTTKYQLGEQTFETAKDFIAAYKATLITPPAQGEQAA